MSSQAFDILEIIIQSMILQCLVIAVRVNDAIYRFIYDMTFVPTLNERVPKSLHNKYCSKH